MNHSGRQEMHSEGDLTDDELEKLRRLETAATPGPWAYDAINDPGDSSMVIVSTEDLEGPTFRRWHEIDPQQIVAATLVQSGSLVLGPDERWDTNAQLIATTRDALPRLLREIARRRAEDVSCPDD